MIAKWNGTTWGPLGSGLQTFQTIGQAFALALFDDGSGPARYADSRFHTSGGVWCPYVARWNGAAWSALAGGIPQAGLAGSEVRSFAVFDDSHRRFLAIGGAIRASATTDCFVTLWGLPAGCGAPGTSVCEPGLAGVFACPCGNPPAGTHQGCDNSASTGGAGLSATGLARLGLDSVVLSTTGERPSATSVVLQGNAFSPSGVVFGQGVRCLTRSLRRLYTYTASAGSITAPALGDAHLSVRSAALGDTIAPGTHRYYGVYYRDPLVLGGCSALSTFNITQQLDIVWLP